MYGINNTLMIKRNITYITSYEILNISQIKIISLINKFNLQYKI